MMYYTVMRLQIDQGKSADPVQYRGKFHKVLGKELTGYLIRHDLRTEKAMPMGDTTRYGTHPFFLTSKPTIDDLMYWNAVKNNSFPVLIGCNGSLKVIDHNGTPFTKDEQYSTAGKKVITQQQRKKLLNARAEKLIKKYFKN